MNDVALYKEAAQSAAGGNNDELVVKHGPLVKRIACHLLSRLPPSVQLDDLIQAGMIGLLEASRNYDPTQGASFETYAGIRIRGAMLDEIRKGDWAPRSLHRKVRELTRAIQEIEAQQGRDAKDVEIAEKMNVGLNEYHDILRQASGQKIFSFEELPSKEEGMTEGLTDAIPGPLEDMERNRFQQALAEAIAGLPDRERLVMSLYYDEELNLRETGEVLGVSESRICQIHAQALVRLRARMKDWVTNQ